MNNIFHHAGLANVVAHADFPPENPLAHVVNGERNRLLLSLANAGPDNFTLVNAAASYHDPARDWALLSNTTASKYNIPLIAGSNFTLPFQVYSEFRPQELGLTVWANLKDASGAMHRMVAYNSTVTVVEPQNSLFDIQLYAQSMTLGRPLFMYLILAAALGGLSYLAYQTLSARYFPKSSTSGGKRFKKSSSATVQGTGEKVVVATDGKGQGGYPASVQPYEEEWIPEHLRSKGETRRRVKTATSEAEGGVTSGGEATSGAEGERKKGAKGKGKGKK
ncbi:hypothetical protein QFC19_003938 [Naganishia cerealis]|uniref:Uncharacterized protein n=1 Tax=Naganishia cerealis TaxID=610337 RepID=A0ACC2VZM4_9TREE|nr:hypothetical protein QFC19_003938 [Naganishia cerealis]